MDYTKRRGTTTEFKSIKAYRSTISKNRNIAPPIPKSLNDLKIPDEYRKTTSGETFLLYDSVNYDG